MKTIRHRQNLEAEEGRQAKDKSGGDKKSAARSCMENSTNANDSLQALVNASIIESLGGDLLQLPTALCCIDAARLYPLEHGLSTAMRTTLIGDALRSAIPEDRERKRFVMLVFQLEVCSCLMHLYVSFPISVFMNRM